jgi:hypothetical protein
MLRICSFNLVFFFLIPIFCFSQEADNSNDLLFKKHNLSFILGTQYNFRYKYRVSEMDTNCNLYPASYSPGGWVGAAYKPAFSYHLGLIYDYRFYKLLGLETGIVFYNRKNTRLANNDPAEREVVNDFNTKYSYALDSFKESTRCESNIEIPLYITFSYKRFSGSIGTKIIVFSFQKATTEFLYNKENRYSYITHSIFKKENYYKYTNYFCPSLKFKYLINKKKIPLSLYIAADLRSNYYIDFQAGLELGFFSFK